MSIFAPQLMHVSGSDPNQLDSHKTMEQSPFEAMSTTTANMKRRVTSRTKTKTKTNGLIFELGKIPNPTTTQ